MNYPHLSTITSIQSVAYIMDIEISDVLNIIYKDTIYGNDLKICETCIKTIHERDLIFKQFKLTSTFQTMSKFKLGKLLCGTIIPGLSVEALKQDHLCDFICERCLCAIVSRKN